MASSGRTCAGVPGGWSAAYFAFQGVATTAWWLLIAASPTWRRWFAFGDAGLSLLQFLPGDVLFWILGSFVVAWGELANASWRGAARHALGGAVVGSLVHAAAVAAIAGTGFAGVLLMMPAVLLTGWLSWTSGR